MVQYHRKRLGRSRRGTCCGRAWSRFGTGIVLHLSSISGSPGHGYRTHRVGKIWNGPAALYYNFFSSRALIAFPWRRSMSTKNLPKNQQERLDGVTGAEGRRSAAARVTHAKNTVRGLQAACATGSAAPSPRDADFDDSANRHATWTAHGRGSPAI